MNTNYNNTFADIAKYRLIIEEAKNELEKLENEIKDYMTINALEELTGNEHKATFKAVTSSRFDTKAFKLDNPAIYEKYSKASESMRFTFK